MSQRPLIVKNTLFNYLSKMLPTTISFVYTIILTQYLGLEDYGLYNYIPAVLVGFFTLFGGNFLNNILWTFTARAKSKEFFTKIVGITIAIALLLIVLVNIFGQVLIQYLNISNTNLLFMASIFLIVTPVNTIYISLFKGAGHFGKVLKTAIIENIVTLALIFLMVIVFGMGLIGAFLAKILALIFSIAYLHYNSLNIGLTDKKIKFKEIKQYGQWNILTNFVRSGAIQFNLIILGVFSSTILIGSYYLIEKITKILMDNISSSIQEIIFSKNSENYRNKKLIESYTSEAIRVGFIINFFLGIIGLIIIPIIILLLFPQFNGAIIYSWLFIFILFINSQAPMLGIFDSINETKNNLKINILFLILTVLLYVPLTLYFSLFGYLVASIIISQTKYMYTMFLLKRYGIHLNIIPKLSDVYKVLGVIKMFIPKI